MLQQADNPIAYCGLYCAECPLYQGEIARLAKDLRARLRQAKIGQRFVGLAKNYADIS